MESYEIKAERVLEEQRDGRVSIAPELDYIDEEDEDALPQVIEQFFSVKLQGHQELFNFSSSFYN